MEANAGTLRVLLDVLKETVRLGGTEVRRAYMKRYAGEEKDDEEFVRSRKCLRYYVRELLLNSA